jgi:hypothetical protein
MTRREGLNKHDQGSTNAEAVRVADRRADSMLSIGGNDEAVREVRRQAGESFSVAGGWRLLRAVLPSMLSGRGVMGCKSLIPRGESELWRRIGVDPQAPSCVKR